MYRAMRRNRRQLRRQRGHAIDYVMPFLILICIGVILVLAVNLWSAIFSPQVKQAAYMHIVDKGDVQLKVWGTDHFFAINSDTLIMQGDQLRTNPNSRVIVEFFDGTLMRVDGNSDVTFESIDDESKVPEINVVLNEGALWFNKVYKDTVDSLIDVQMDHLLVHSDMASVFAVEDFEDQVVRVKNVFKNNEGVSVDIYSEDGSSVVESEKIGVAQEIVFNVNVFKKYWEFKSPTVLTGIDNDFEQSDWYQWNTTEDKSPASFDKTAGGTENVGLSSVDEEVVEPEVVQDEEAVEPETSEESADVVEPDPVVTTSVSAPTVVSVAGGTEVNADGFYVVKSNPATIIGSVSGASKVIVNGFTLSKFKPGDTQWTYFANADYQLLKEGENTYEVYAYDADDNRSAPLIVKILYQPQTEEEVAPPTTEETPAEPTG